MTDEEIMESIKQEEGLRLEFYLDTLGNRTIGYGHLVNATSSFRNVESISKTMAEDLFRKDFKRVVSDYYNLELNLDPVRKSAIYDLLFNVGYPKLLKFTKFLAALKGHRWEAAAHELSNSRYAKQLPNRSKRNIHKILTGTILLEK